MNGFNEHLTAALDEAVRDVVAEAMVDLARELGYWRRLPKLQWSLDVFAPLVSAQVTGQVGAEHPDARALGIARQWAGVLGLVEVPEPQPGLVEFAGLVDGRPVRVRAVVTAADGESRS